MKFLRLLFSLTAILCFTAAIGQTRNCALTLKVNTATGESVAGLTFSLKHIEYSLNYSVSETKLDANGTCVIKLYAGDHQLIIEKDGYNTHEETFTINGEKEINVTLTEAVQKPYSLTTKLDHDAFTGTNNVHFQWNTEAPAFFDDFESYPDFAINFGDWTGIDGDLLAAAPLAGIYQNRGTLQYAQIINPMTVDPTWWYEYEVLRPYSGKQYVGFVRTSTGEANNDWLISPSITVGTRNIVRFMAKAADVYKEKFEVGITTVDNPKAEDFTIISESNYETVSYQTWRAVTYDLSKYAGQKVKIAIHYMGEANRGGAFMLMVDDFYVGQEGEAALKKAKRAALHSAANPNEKFHIFVDGNKVGETAKTSYTIENLAARKEPYVLGVKAVYTSSETELATTELTISPDNYAAADFTIATNNGASAEGLKIEITDKANGEQINATAGADGKAHITSLPLGEYLISVDTDEYDHFEQTLVVTNTAANAMTINLVEKIITPYNVTATVTANAENTSNIDILMRWNQDLGFEDSFETYPDFATTFGDWTSIDNDQLPVYPVALGSMDNVITWPGSGSATSPQPIAPTVFNPLTTKPTMKNDPGVIAPTGDKTVIFFSPQMAKADKWLISPKQTIRESYEWKLTAKAYDKYPEVIQFCVSSSKDINSFTVLDEVTLPYGEWQIFSLDLSAYEGQEVYLAVHYISTDAFFAQIDDFYVGPSAGNSVINVGKVLNYEVTLDGNKAGETEKTQYTLANITDATHTIGITANYATGKSETAVYNYKKEGGVESIEETGVKIISGAGVITVITTNDCMTEIYDYAGRLTAKAQACGYNTFSLNPGMYIVKAGQTTTKVIVK